MEIGGGISGRAGRSDSILMNTAGLARVTDSPRGAQCTQPIGVSKGRKNYNNVTMCESGQPTPSPSQIPSMDGKQFVRE